MIFQCFLLLTAAWPVLVNVSHVDTIEANECMVPNTTRITFSEGHSVCVRETVKEIHRKIGILTCEK